MLTHLEWVAKVDDGREVDHQLHEQFLKDRQYPGQRALDPQPVPEVASQNLVQEEEQHVPYNEDTGIQSIDGREKRDPD